MFRQFLSNFIQQHGARLSHTVPADDAMRASHTTKEHEALHPGLMLNSLVRVLVPGHRDVVRFIN